MSHLPRQERHEPQIRVLIRTSNEVVTAQTILHPDKELPSWLQHAVNLAKDILLTGDGFTRSARSDADPFEDADQGHEITRPITERQVSAVRMYCGDVRQRFTSCACRGDGNARGRAV
ncbi:MAG: hypothetical protein WD825_17595 [Gemmatimonadaceae bacterium]